MDEKKFTSLIYQLDKAFEEWKKPYCELYNADLNDDQNSEFGDALVQVYRFLEE